MAVFFFLFVSGSRSDFVLFVGSILVVCVVWWYRWWWHRWWYSRRRPVKRTRLRRGGGGSGCISRIGLGFIFSDDARARVLVRKVTPSNK